ncbi:hypothetical protein HPB50_014556 [Hyalomma asiaticum]|uniref:Uncharacterized protein n=1 Tax=Hyalomma asiaticum TaxID=266040 RepID=A0ACB7TPB0_HYAAI|nr:hypothetical protein HPB50_014556 [Hyalomma asiaticum]
MHVCTPPDSRGIQWAQRTRPPQRAFARIASRRRARNSTEERVLRQLLRGRARENWIVAPGRAVYESSGSAREGAQQMLRNRRGRTVETRASPVLLCLQQHFVRLCHPRRGLFFGPDAACLSELATRPSAPDQTRGRLLIVPWPCTRGAPVVTTMARQAICAQQEVHLTQIFAVSGVVAVMLRTMETRDKVLSRILLCKPWTGKKWSRHVVVVVIPWPQRRPHLLQYRHGPIPPKPAIVSARPGLLHFYSYVQLSCGRPRPAQRPAHAWRTSRSSSRKTTTSFVFSCFSIDSPDSPDNRMGKGRLRLCHFCRSPPVVLARHEARPPSSANHKAKRQQEDYDRLRPLSYPDPHVLRITENGSTRRHSRNKDSTRLARHPALNGTL